MTPYHVQPTTSSGAKRGTRQHWRTTQKNKGNKNRTVDITFVGDYVLPMPLCNDYVVGMGVITIEEGERAESIKAKITQIMQGKQLPGEPIFLKCSNKLLDEPGTQPNWVWDEANVRAALLKSSAKLYILIKKPQTEPEPSLSSDDDGLPELRSLRSRPGRSTEASPMRSPRSVSPPLPTFNLNGPSQDSYEDAAVYTNFM